MKKKGLAISVVFLICLNNLTAQETERFYDRFTGFSFIVPSHWNRDSNHDSTLGDSTIFSWNPGEDPEEGVVVIFLTFLLNNWGVDSRKGIAESVMQLLGNDRSAQGLPENSEYKETDLAGRPAGSIAIEENGLHFQIYSLTNDQYGHAVITYTNPETDENRALVNALLEDLRLYAPGFYSDRETGITVNLEYSWEDKHDTSEFGPELTLFKRSPYFELNIYAVEAGILGIDSDEELLNKAENYLLDYGIPYERNDLAPKSVRILGEERQARRFRRSRNPGYTVDIYGLVKDGKGYLFRLTFRDRTVEETMDQEATEILRSVSLHPPDFLDITGF